MITRSIQAQIEKWLFQKKIIIIYGARQVGKTTLSKVIMSSYPEDSLYLSLESLSYRELFETENIELIKDTFNGKKLIVLDEAQNVRNIGIILKQLVDTYPEIQIIATGSSSFELANKVSEPLTGRNRKYQLYPLSMKEISQKYSIPVMIDKLENILRFGTYPEVFDQPENIARENLDYIASDYLYKDILMFENLQKSDVLIKILKALAFQIGGEVTYRDLSRTTLINPETISKYIDLLEKCFIIFKLPCYSRNMRNELKKSFKIYFYDLGIRNSLIKNFNRMSDRLDFGGIWENFCIIERVKQIQANNEYGNLYFWRSYNPDKEIDFIEEKDGKLFTYEFKYNPKASGNARLPKNFLESYGEGLDEQGNSKNITYKVVDTGNWWQWLI